MNTRRMEPSPEERAIALRVLRFYGRLAEDLAKETEQERPGEWSTALEGATRLFKEGNPSKTFADYRQEWLLSNPPKNG